MEDLEFLVFGICIKIHNAFIFHRQQVFLMESIVYDNPQLKVRLKVPPDWKLVEKFKMAKVKDLYDIIFFPPTVTVTDVYAPNIIVMLRDQTEKFLKFTLKQLTKMSIKGEKKAMKKFKILTPTQDTVVASYPAKVVKVEGIPKNAKEPITAQLMLFYIMTNENDKFYRLSYGNLADEFNDHLDVFQEMVKSLEIYE